MLNIGSSATVMGANDNASGVAALLALTRRLETSPVGIRVILVFTGAEESFMEGMQGFGQRHFPSLPRANTWFICVDNVGAGQLSVMESEGMLWATPYSPALRELVQACASRCGGARLPEIVFRNATHGLVPLRAGYQTAGLVAVADDNLPPHYHQPTDTPRNVRSETILAATELLAALVHELASNSSSSQIVSTAPTTDRPDRPTDR